MQGERERDEIFLRSNSSERRQSGAAAKLKCIKLRTVTVFGYVEEERVVERDGNKHTRRDRGYFMQFTELHKLVNVEVNTSLSRVNKRLL